MKGTSYAAGTILNALATGIGGAFGINMKTTVKLKPDDSDKIKIIVNGKERKSVVAERILRQADTGGTVEVHTDIPEGSGLGSSSAFVNSLLVAVNKFKGDVLDAYRILKTNARLSVETGISYTGAFDDASASLLGGFVVSDNLKMKLYRWDKLESNALVLIPAFSRGDIDWKTIRENSARLKAAVKATLNGDYFTAMKKNTEYYCEMIGYPLEIAKAGWDMGICCGLSGNGPSYVAFGSKSEIKSLAAIWKEYGNVYIGKVVKTPSEDVVIPDSLFMELA